VGWRTRRHRSRFAGRRFSAPRKASSVLTLARIRASSTNELSHFGKRGLTLAGELVRYTKTPTGVEVRPALSLNVSGVNILGNLGRVLGEVILYRIEARRAQERLYEMQKREDLARAVIDAHTKERLAELRLQAHALDGELWRAAQGISLQKQTLDAMTEGLRAINDQIRRLGNGPNATRDRQLAFDAQRELTHLISEFTSVATRSTADTVAAIVARLSSDLLAKLRALQSP
jgi:hypothetical protein